MTDKIYFTNNINKLFSDKIGNLYKSSIIIYHELYEKPIINAKQIIAWQKYKNIYQDVFADEIVLVGLNRMITPSNRCNFIFDYLTTLTPNIPKIVIDSAPFIGEPWRLFFHYLFSNTNKFGYNYSYPIEGEWSKWFYREINDCQLSANNLNLFISNTYCDLKTLTTTYSFSETSLEDIEWYEQIKQHVLSKYSTPKIWVTNILKETNKKFGLTLSYDSYLNNFNYVVPDLGVYRFVVEECRRRQAIYNVFTIT